MMQFELTLWRDGKPTGETVPVEHRLALPKTSRIPVSGYGAQIPLSWMVHYRGKWRRVYAACYGNASTAYIGRPGAWVATVECT